MELGVSGAPIGNGYLGIKWSRDRWRHVTLKGQGRDPNMHMAQYLENGCRYRIGSNGPTIGNGALEFDWSRDWWRHVTQKGQGRDPDIFGAHYLENGWRYRLGSNGPPLGNGPLRFESSLNWWRHVTLKGQGHDPNIFGYRYLDSGWRYGLCANGAPIGNGNLRIKLSRHLGDMLQKCYHHFLFLLFSMCNYAHNWCDKLCFLHLFESEMIRFWWNFVCWIARECVMLPTALYLPGQWGFKVILGTNEDNYGTRLISFVPYICSAWLSDIRFFECKLTKYIHGWTERLSLLH